MDLPLITILGPTASGKTGYAIQLARLIDGEIICADSRTVYRGMDIGTAKPTAAEQRAVPHWGLDLVEPNQRFTVYDFQCYAEAKIAEIRARNHVPLLVGGTGLYLNAVLYRYQFAGSDQSEQRAVLEQMGLNELKNYAIQLGIELPVDWRNRRRLIRAIERGGVNNKCSQLRGDAIVIGITASRPELAKRSALRSQQMLEDGLVAETRRLLDQYSIVEPLRRNAYGAVLEYLDGQLQGQAELLNKIITLDGRLVKKQLTWWRNRRWAGDIMWRSLDELTNQLATWSQLTGSEIIDQLVAEYKKFYSSR